MPNNSTDAAEAINRSFEPDDVSPESDSAENNAWLNDRLSECYND